MKFIYFIYCKPSQPMTLEAKIGQLRSLQKEVKNIVEDIFDSYDGKCKDGLLDVIETILDNASEFADTESVVKMLDTISEGIKSKKERKKERKKAD